MCDFMPAYSETPMGIGHWIMEHFWLVAIASLIVMFAAHYAITWLLKTVRN